PAPQYYTALTGADASPSTGTTPAKWNLCSVCHGTNGQGVAGLGPEIRHINPTYANWVVRNGRGGMAKYSTTDYTDTELTEILTWLGAMPKPTTADGLYKDFCGTCHGPMNPTGGAVP